MTDVTNRCRAALQTLRSGPVAVRRIDAYARKVLRERGLLWEVTEGQLELTPRGRGVDPATFEA